MSEDWSAIASEVSEALGELGMICTLRRAAQRQTDAPQANPYDDAPELAAPIDYAITAMQEPRETTDTQGTFIGRTQTMLTVTATGVAPLKSDTIALNIKPDDVTDDTVFFDIVNVSAPGPAGIPYQYGVLLRD